MPASEPTSKPRRSRSSCPDRTPAWDVPAGSCATGDQEHRHRHPARTSDSTEIRRAVLKAATSLSTRRYGRWDDETFSVFRFADRLRHVRRTDSGRPSITVVGLGTGDERFVTAPTIDFLETTPVRVVRRPRHPSGGAAGDATPFDDVYDAEAPSVMCTRPSSIGGGGRTEHGHVVYAVHGRRSCSNAQPSAARRTRASTAACCTAIRSSIQPTNGWTRPDRGSRGDRRSRFGPGHAATVARCWWRTTCQLGAEATSSRRRIGKATSRWVILQGLGTARRTAWCTPRGRARYTIEAEPFSQHLHPASGNAVGAELVRFINSPARVLRGAVPMGSATRPISRW